MEKKRVEKCRLYAVANPLRQYTVHGTAQDRLINPTVVELVGWNGEHKFDETAVPVGIADFNPRLMGVEAFDTQPVCIQKAK